MTMKSGEAGTTGDLFYNFYYEDTKENAAHILRKLADALENSTGEIIDDIEIDLDNDDEDEK